MVRGGLLSASPPILAGVKQKYTERLAKMHAQGGLASKVERFVKSGFQFASDDDELVRIGSDGDETILMSDVHILVLDESKVPKELRRTTLRLLPTREVLPAVPVLMFDLAVVRCGVRLMACSHNPFSAALSRPNTLSTELPSIFFHLMPFA